MTEVFKKYWGLIVVLGLVAGAFSLAGCVGSAQDWLEDTIKVDKPRALVGPGERPRLSISDARQDFRAEERELEAKVEGLQLYAEEIGEGDRQVTQWLGVLQYVSGSVQTAVGEVPGAALFGGTALLSAALGAFGIPQPGQDKRERKAADAAWDESRAQTLKDLGKSV